MTHTASGSAATSGARTAVLELSSTHRWLGLVRERASQAAFRSVKVAAGVAGTIRRIARGREVRQSQRLRLMCVVDLIQDIDLILPVAVAARNSGRFDVVICQTDWLLKVSPRVGSLLSQAGFDPILLPRKALLLGFKPDLASVEALLQCSESTAPAHRFGHALACRANREGVPTFVMQHGLENICLTYRDETDPEFASRHILTWGDPRGLPDWVPEQRRRRCIGVGIPKPAIEKGISALPLPENGRPIVAVFENLHWERYSPKYVAGFLADLAAAITARPELLFIVKPHHAGRWLSKNPDALDRSAANLIVADPTDPKWEPFTAGAIIERAAAVITTPSTVALDAARISRPIAVAGYDLDLPVYAPLPILHGAAEWDAFLQDTLTGGTTARAGMADFCRRHILEGDALATILAAIEKTVRSASPSNQHARA